MVRRIGVIILAVLCAAVGSLAGAASSGAADDEIPAGFVDGREHELRVRPVLGEIAPERGRASKLARRTSAAAVAMCDPVQVAALPRVVTTTRAGDDPAACVALTDGDAKAKRLLLGAALLTGSDVGAVLRRRVAKGRSRVVLHLSPSGDARWTAIAAQAGPGPFAVTLDGRVLDVVAIEVDPAAVSNRSVHAAFLGGKRGLSSSDVDELVDRLDQSRSEAVIELGRQAGLTKAARVIYGRADPRLDDKDELVGDCPVFEAEQTLVLGCFGAHRIFIVRVDRPGLASVMPVTAAHEMLHAAYAELSADERKKIDKLVAAYLATSGDTAATRALDEYAGESDALLRNEAHSIVGTVDRALPKPLERYYARYFKDRATLVAEFESYQQVFDDLEAKITGLEGELDALDAQLKAMDGEINAAAAESQRLFDQIEELRREGRVNASNDLVDAQNAAANRSNALIEQYNALVGQYNGKLAELNAASLTAIDLYQSLSPYDVTAGG